jgi:hypothetical protein
MTVLRPIRNQLLNNVDRREHFRLFYPRSWKMEPNPFSLAARRDALEWFARMGLVRDEGTRRILAEERLALCGGYLFPTANFEQLVTLVEFLGLWNLSDNLLLEGSEGPGTPPEGPLSPATELPLHAWRDLCQRFTQQSPGWRTQLSERFAAWVQGRAKRGARTEVLGASGHPAQTASYPGLDDGEIGAMPAFYLIEYVGGFELPEAVRQHEVMQELNTIGSQLMLWAHELIGLESDPRTHEPDPAERCPDAGDPLDRADLADRALAQAMGRIVELHNQHVFKFLDVERALPAFGDLQPFVDTYLQLMHYLIRGFAEWKLGAGRRDRTRPPGPRRGSVSLSLSSFSEE